MNPQLILRDYNKMNTNGDGDDGDTVVGYGDDAYSSLDPMAVQIGALLLVPAPNPFRR
jgi:hypothetical protein